MVTPGATFQNPPGTPSGPDPSNAFLDGSRLWPRISSYADNVTQAMRPLPWDAVSTVPDVGPVTPTVQRWGQVAVSTRAVARHVVFVLKPLASLKF